MALLWDGIVRVARKWSQKVLNPLFDLFTGIKGEDCLDQVNAKLKEKSPNQKPISGPNAVSELSSAPVPQAQGGVSQEGVC